MDKYYDDISMMAEHTFNFWVSS